MRVVLFFSLLAALVAHVPTARCQFSIAGAFSNGATSVSGSYSNGATNIAASFGGGGAAAGGGGGGGGAGPAQGDANPTYLLPVDPNQAPNGPQGFFAANWFNPMNPQAAQYAAFTGGAGAGPPPGALQPGVTAIGVASGNNSPQSFPCFWTLLLWLSMHRILPQLPYRWPHQLCYMEVETPNFLASSYQQTCRSQRLILG